MRKVFMLVLLLTNAAGGNAQQVAQNELKRMTLEELMDINVTSVARTADPLSRTAAAVTVITAEDIRRSGITNIPDLFRMVPGMDVARFAAGSWAIDSKSNPARNMRPPSPHHMKGSPSLKRKEAAPG